MKTDIKTQMEAEKPNDVLADLEAKHGLAPARCCAALVGQWRAMAKAHREHANIMRTITQQGYERALVRVECYTFCADMLEEALAQHNEKS